MFYRLTLIGSLALALLLPAALFAQAPPAAPGTPAPAASTPAANTENAPAEAPAQGDAAAQPSAAAPADETPDAAAEETEDEAASTSGLADTFRTCAIGLLIEGGVFMWPILILGILAVGVIIERYRSLKMLSTDTEALRARVRQYLDEDRVEDALELCNREQGPVPAILATGLRQFVVLRRLNYDPAKISEQVVKSMDDYGIHIVAALERHLPILATVSSVAPMIGFLGTVQGMIVAFKDIVEQMGKTNIVEAAASGIQVSLLTTCFGLIVGIPAFMAFNYFTSVINRFVLDVEESATELIESVTLQMALAQREKEEAVLETETV